MENTHTLIWLFADDLFHQILFYFGTVVAMGILIWEKKNEKPIQWKWIFSFFLFCLFVSCFQAWVDEHHNSERLIEEKSDLSKQLGFWQGQSYAKDEAIRSRDMLVFQGLQTLSGTQQTENQTQHSLTLLASKLFDVTKPEPIRISTKVMALTRNPNAPPNATNAGILVADTNRRIASFSGKITCSSAFTVEEVQMLQGIMSLSPAYTQSAGQTEMRLDFTGSAWDAGQPIVAIIFGNNLEVNKCLLMQQ